MYLVIISTILAQALHHQLTATVMMMMMSPTNSNCDDDDDVVVECDIGKLLDLNINIDDLSRDEKYQLLTSDPCTDSSSYPRTCSSESAPYRQFQPSWLKSYP